MIIYFIFNVRAGLRASLIWIALTALHHYLLEMNLLWHHMAALYTYVLRLLAGSRVTLDMTTLTIMRILPREVDPLVYHMAAEDPGKVSYSDIGTCPRVLRFLSISFQILES